MTSVQGQAEQVQQFVFAVIAEQPGTYQSGPARIDGSSSGSATLTVVQAQKAQQAAPRYELKLKAKTAVPMERIPFVLRFISHDLDIKLIHLETPHASGVIIGPLSQGAAKAELDGSSVVEYTGYLFLDKPGTVTIPPLRADYKSRSSGRVVVFRLQA